MTKAEYGAYLLTEHWRTVRAAALEHADHRCQVCNSPRKLHAHHRTYARCPGRELPRDITILCEKCHALYHDQGRPEKPPAQPRTEKAKRRAARKQLRKEGYFEGPQRKPYRPAPSTASSIAMEARDVEERRRRKAEREAIAKQDFLAGRDAKPWDKHETRISGAHRARRNAKGKLM